MKIVLCTIPRLWHTKFRCKNFLPTTTCLILQGIRGNKCNCCSSASGYLYSGCFYSADFAPLLLWDQYFPFRDNIFRCVDTCREETFYSKLTTPVESCTRNTNFCFTVMSKKAGINFHCVIDILLDAITCNCIQQSCNCTQPYPVKLSFFFAVQIADYNRKIAGLLSATSKLLFSGIL